MRLLSAIFCLSTSIAISQPLVHQEPHHIPVFQNSHVRVMDVSAQAGDTTQFHIHKNDIAYFTIQGSSMWLQELGGEPRNVTLPTGWSGSDLTHSKTPLIHRFANVGDVKFQLIAVEVLSDRFAKKVFTKTELNHHESARFSIGELTDKAFVSEVPCILIQLSESGHVTILDYLKPGKQLPVLSGANSTRVVIIQFK
ncbi:MAG: hypothetical protein RIM99_02765 [Cyclobacteriaceae bacterium]